MSTDVSDQFTDEELSTGPTSFVVREAESPAEDLTVTDVSNNQGIVPDANVVIEVPHVQQTFTSYSKPQGGNVGPILLRGPHLVGRLES